MIDTFEQEVRKNMICLTKVDYEYKCNKDIRVLIGDYNQQVLGNSIMVLESVGIKNIDMVSSGVEMVQKIKNGEKYDVIITNNIYKYGKCDGIDVLTELKQINDFKTPIVVLTISAGQRDLFIKVYGFDEYMTKLLTQEQLLEILPKVIEGLKFEKGKKLYHY